MTIQEQMRLYYENPVISWHEHVWFKPGTMEMDVARMENDLAHMETLGIDRIVVSNPLAANAYCPPEDFIAANTMIYEATKRYPGKLYGMAFVNPGFHDAAINELQRCVTELGFLGVKLYNHYFMDDPTQFDLVEKCIDLDVPVLMHSGKCNFVNVHKSQPRISNGVHMANIGRRYPEGTFLMGHIGGGGDWQWSVKAISKVPNVYADMSGSVHDCPLLEESVRYLGADRILFATDGQWDSSVAKILGADITDAEKKTILAGSAFERFIQRRKS